MSRIRANTITNAAGTGSPTFPNGANIVGVVTATTFVGDLTGNATGISGTPNLNAGIVTASSISINGNVSIAGTLTYEDVTNVDSIGLITARSGIQVLSGGINAVGVVTATSFVGDGAGLTGVESWNQTDTWLYG